MHVGGWPCRQWAWGATKRAVMCDHGKANRDPFGRGTRRCWAQFAPAAQPCAYYWYIERNTRPGKTHQRDGSEARRCGLQPGPSFEATQRHRWRGTRNIPCEICKLVIEEQRQNINKKKKEMMQRDVGENCFPAPTATHSPLTRRQWRTARCPEWQCG